MAVLIKNNHVTYDPWHKIEEDNLQTETTSSFSILPLEVFSEVHDWPEKCKPTQYCLAATIVTG